MLKILTFIMLLILSFISFADGCQRDPSLDCSASLSKVEIGEPLTESHSRDVKKFFGLHLLFWGVQTEMQANTPSRASNRAVSILQQSGVGFLRYGGGVNEIDWRGCVGPLKNRPKQKLVNWAGPMQCIFGLGEYEKLNDELGVSSSWHIANVVGFEGNINPIENLTKDAGERARLVKELSGNRQRFWEIGNELDRDTLKWSAEKITDRGLPVAQAIKKNDTTARIIIPLMEYSPPWVTSADEHNRTLIQQHKSVASDYTLHLYYDNAPWGPSVANRLASVRHIEKIIKSEGIVNPAIWITEHARPPPGTPADKNWNKTWYQTGNHDAVMATADFLIGLSQIPMAQGAAWHGQGMRVGPWTFIDIVGDGVLFETRTSRLFELLKPSFNYQTLSTKTTSVSDSNLTGGYSIRATAFTDKDNQLGSNCVVWLVNRSSGAKNVRLQKNSFKQSSWLKVQQINMSDSYNPQVPIKNLPVFSQLTKPINGAITIPLPKRSVVLLKISPNNSL